MEISAGNLKKGDFILFSSNVWQVQQTEFSFKGRGLANVRTRLKNVSTKKNIEQTFKSSEQVKLANVSSVLMQYLYEDGGNLYFMNEKDYSQYSLPKELVGKTADFLKTGDSYYVFVLDDNVINIRPPINIELKVVETEEATKGDTEATAKKKAVLETGVIVMVPLFIKEEDVIVVNPETGEYVERVKS